MHSGSSLSPSNPAFSVSIGIASLVLEGRPLSDDDYIPEIPCASTSYLPATITAAAAAAASSSAASAIGSTSAHHHKNVTGANSCSSSAIATSSCTSATSFSAASASLPQDTVQHIQRLRQKLLLLRSSPSTSSTHHDNLHHHDSLPLRQKSAKHSTVSLASSSSAQSYDSDEELEMIYKKQQQLHEGNVLSSLQSLATTCLKTTPRSFNKTHGLLKTVEAWTTASGTITQQSRQIASKISAQFAENLKKKQIGGGAGVGGKSLGQQTASTSMATKQHGPHCEQFLKKIGLIKGCIGGAAVSLTVGEKAAFGNDDFLDFDEHFCSASNENCYRWQIHYRQLVSVFSRGDPICIEVYLGPENHVILLEQWIIQQCDRSNQLTMTLQSLCSAIRSQLYFSQITAWTDLLKTTSQFDVEFQSNPRLKLSATYKPKLDILYRIRPYDTTACFRSKPMVHNFPDTIISDSLAVKVCLKSLPRLDAIPRLQDENHAPNIGDILLPFGERSPHHHHHNQQLQHRHGTQPSTSSSSTYFDDRLMHPCTEKGKHHCGFDDEESEATDDMDITISTVELSHRDRQLMKYKRRLLKRDRKKRNESSTSISGDDVTMTSISTNNSPAIATTTTCLGYMLCPTDGVLMSGKLHEDNTINSIRPPLYSNTTTTTMAVQNQQKQQEYDNYRHYYHHRHHHLQQQQQQQQQHLLATKSTQTASIEMNSVSTQTDIDVLTFPNCNFCGIEMQYLCWNCDNNIQMPSGCVPLSSSPKSGAANLLLRSIQRTPSAGKLASNKHNQSQVLRCNGGGGGNVASTMNGGVNLASLINRSPLSSPVINGNSNQLPKSNDCNNQHNDDGIDGKMEQISDEDDIDNDDDSTTCEKSVCDSLNVDISDCRLCKRQKTVHNYFNNFNYNNNNNNNIINNKINDNDNSLIAAQSTTTSTADNNDSLYRRTMSECLDISSTASTITNLMETDLITPKNGLPLIDLDLKMYRRAYSEDLLACGCDNDNVDQMTTKNISELPVDHKRSSLSSSTTYKHHCQQKQFKTPTTQHQQYYLSPTPPNKINCKTNPLYVSCSDDRKMDYAQYMNTIKNQKFIPIGGGGGGGCINKPIPKVNLSKVFSISPLSWDHHTTAAATTTLSCSSPISIQSNSFTFENLSPTITTPTATTTIISSCSIAGSSLSISGTSIGSSSSTIGIVHKSNSAPTFPNSPVLSPRFLKSAAIHKRRSRHLSDRSSERSSIGSDEQFSDEEYGFGLDNTYSPVISPTKVQSHLVPIAFRPFQKATLFGRRPLLGSFEEALLQRCLKPKFHVNGFKVLLGASGGFCPTQLTLAASTYFYELQGQSLSTPYTCEIRLPRKGYSIPRTGTVQATLLNPLGMVVRMFVVPYDFRDMPNMSQTFIRQRVLAFDENSNSSRRLETLTAAEQMKILRYTIHLRFQTSRSGRLALHTDIRMLISRRTDCDTAAAHAKDALESPNELQIVTIVPDNPKFSTRSDNKS